MNIQEIAAALGVSQPTASVHIRVLEEAGLVESEYFAVGRGSEKRCRTTFDKLVFELHTAASEPEDHFEETRMPVGLFTSVSAICPCGLANEGTAIGFLDNPQSFLLPDRVEAQVLWFASGWIEYTFPCNIPPKAEVTGLELVLELCSEAPSNDNEWPSDITLWINGIDVGTWTCPGDFGDVRGRLNPAWWPADYTQYGALKTWTVDQSGSRVDGITSSSVEISDLGVKFGQPIVVKIGNKPDAIHNGGINLFGRRFGNYPQDIILRTHYRLKPTGGPTR